MFLFVVGVILVCCYCLLVAAACLCGMCGVCSLLLFVVLVFVKRCVPCVVRCGFRVFARAVVH